MRRIRLAPRVADMLPEFALKQTLRKAAGVHFLYSLTLSLTVFTLPHKVSNLSRLRTIVLLYCSSFFLTFLESLLFANLARTLRAFFKLSDRVIGRARSTSSAAPTPSAPSVRSGSWERMRSAAWIPSMAVVSFKIEQIWLEWVCFLHAA